MIITFYLVDGSKRILRPIKPIPVDVIRTLAHDFGAIKFEAR